MKPASEINTGIHTVLYHVLPQRRHIVQHRSHRTCRRATLPGRVSGGELNTTKSATQHAPFKVRVGDSRFGERWTPHSAEEGHGGITQIKLTTLEI